MMENSALCLEVIQNVIFTSAVDAKEFIWLYLIISNHLFSFTKKPRPYCLQTQLGWGPTNLKKSLTLL